MQDWKSVYACGKQYQAEMIVEALKNNDIDAHILNKQDSVYLFGDIEVYVKAEHVIKAKYIIKTGLGFE